MASSARLLGFAFTNADFLFEMDKNGTILFAAGAAKALVNVPNLPELCAELPADKAEALMQRIGDTIQSCGGTAGQLSDTSFGAVASATRGKLDLAKKLAEAIAADGLTPPKMSEAQVG